MQPPPTTKNDLDYIYSMNGMKLLLCAPIVLLASCKLSMHPYAVTSDKAPKAIGPYSQAVVHGNTVYCSGQIGLNPATGTLVGESIEVQTKQALDNLKAVVETSGSDMKHVLKVNIYITNMGDFSKVNDIYKDYFPDLKPARATVQVAALPKNSLIEIECIAAKTK